MSGQHCKLELAEKVFLYSRKTAGNTIAMENTKLDSLCIIKATSCCHGNTITQQLMQKDYCIDITALVMWSMVMIVFASGLKK